MPASVLSLTRYALQPSSGTDFGVEPELILMLRKVVFLFVLDERADLVVWLDLVDSGSGKTPVSLFRFFILLCLGHGHGFTYAARSYQRPSSSLTLSLRRHLTIFGPPSSPDRVIALPTSAAVFGS
jgi:hypothetical protein